MKILSLNIWGGRAGAQKLLAFFAAHQDVDVFCLQEVWSAPYEHLEGALMGGVATSNADVMTYGMQAIAAALPEHEVFFHPHHLENYGLMMLVKKSLTVTESGDVFVYRERGYVPQDDAGNCARNIQYVTLETSVGLRTVINFHGLWAGKGVGKGDTDARIAQSENIVAFAQARTNPYVLVGDFNLLPTTRSLKLLEDAGMRNLIRAYSITSTRTSLYTKPERYADYAFVSEGVEVQDFSVLPDEVSDHAPLLLEVH